MQTLLSLQSGLVAHVVGNVLLQFPEEHVSVVAAFPSLHCALVVQQPDTGAYVPAHDPPPQVSGVVHALPSVQAAPLFPAGWPQIPVVHVSVVQGLPSSVHVVPFEAAA